MPNLLDIRRRIRSVRNTQQLTKAMKTVSAAKLRRAQERALQARPFAQMLTNVLQSVVSRAELYDPETGLPLHPLLRETRPEKTVLIIVITGDRGLAGAFNTNVLKAPLRFTNYLADKNIDVVAIGRKGRDFFRKRRARISGDEFDAVEEIAERNIKQYDREEIDGVYLVFNEFKSVIAQRVIVQRILPVQEIGRREVTQMEELSTEARERMGEAAKSAGVSLREVCHCSGRLHLGAAARGTAERHSAPSRSHPDLLQLVGIGGSRERCANDGDGFGHQQCE